MDTKVQTITGVDQRDSSVQATTYVLEQRGIDEAYKYLEKAAATSGDDVASLKALRRKTDCHIMPIAFCCYTMQFIDKALINVSTADPPSPRIQITTLTIANIVCCRDGAEQRPQAPR